MKNRISTGCTNRFQVVLSLSVFVSWIFPAVAFANAIATAPQPTVGDFGAAALIIPGTGVVSDPGGLLPDIVRVPSGQTTAGVSALLTDVTSCTSLSSCQNASASADLASGALRLFAAANDAQAGISATGTSAPWSAQVAQGSLFDTILPQSSGTAHFEVTINGSLFAGEPGLLSGNVFSSPRLLFRADSLSSGALLPETGFSFSSEGAALYSIRPDCFSSSLQSVNCTLGFDVNLTAGDPTEISLFMETAAWASSCCYGGAGTVMDFSHTIGLTETGADFTSASGVFLTQPLATVPVPASVWLFGSGLAGLLGIARRKTPSV